MIKAVIFDAIDTLFAAYPDKITMYQRIIKEVCNIDVTYEKMKIVWNEVIGNIEKEAENSNFDESKNLWDNFNGKILEAVGYTETDILEKGEILRLESWTNPENFSLYPDVRPTLEKLSEQNIIIACISNEAAGLNNFFTHFDIDSYFQNITISEVVNYEKPCKEIFNIGIEALKITPAEAIYVGDSYSIDYLGAKNAGLFPVLIDRDKICDESIENKISDLNEIFNLIENIGDKIHANTTT